MSPIVLLALGYAAMLAVFAAAYGALLAFHDPRRPRWLNTGWADNVVTIGLMTLTIFAFAWPVKTLLALGADPLAALTAVILTGAFSARAVWRVLHIRERLDAAHRGQSPFAEMRHIRRGERGGFGTGAFGST